VKAEPQPVESVDLTECIHRTTELFQPVFDDEGLELVVILPPRKVIIRANDRRIRQVLINLLNNARDSLDGQGRVQVRLTCENKSATLVVEDTGEGIAAGEFDRVFEPFFSTKETGVGLGLTLVRQYVQEIGGNIACANRPQGGACFRVYVPIECAPVGDRL
jgi:signal transduction histidine kinase